MNLLMRRRMLLAQQQDDGNLARLSLSNFSQRTEATTFLNGYMVKTTSYAGKYTQYRAFNLTTPDITESLWGKKIRVSADLTNSVSGASPLFRLGYVNMTDTWTQRKETSAEGGGTKTLEYQMPDTRPDNMKSEAIMLLLNTQVTETSPLNTITITNVRLEVIE